MRTIAKVFFNNTLSQYIKVLVWGWILSFVMVAAAKARPLIITGEEFPPYEFLRDGQAVGIDIEIARHILQEQMGLEVQFELTSWQRAWAKVETGQADAVLTTSRQQAREPYLYYPQTPMWRSELVFFTRRSNQLADFQGLQDQRLPAMKVGIINGNSYVPEFWQVFPYKDASVVFQGDTLAAAKGLNPQLEGAVSLKHNLLKLAAGRVDLVLAKRVPGLYLIRSLGLQDVLTYYPQIVAVKDYPMPFVRASHYPDLPKIAQEYEQRLIAFKATPAYQAIIDRWIH
ncbi:polar amino acid transport system substrate-binding protein [Allopseudospirillum japonicum]|uniref:Polar amino acid transport system substrate-binding protein n=1 Tax=Allopseudospirillum japonicum TaxID=64971 RepID=A0A1H6SQ84_9GAMM|nr:transporter substrate-binding domain-containing protein [Allopseudospirillum japonicum]SEI66957.1 polar amino acid transport system substrate-binding protein [Allopseudospirillum japonicum]